MPHGRFRSVRFWHHAALAILASSSLARAGGNALYSVAKTALYEQTSASGPVPATPYPYNFSAEAPIAATLSIPAGPTVTLQGSGSDDEYFEAYYANSGNLGIDNYDPVGTYTMSGSGITTLYLPLSPDSYPTAIPAVTGGTWSNGILVIDPASADTINFSDFSTYASAGVAGYIELTLTDLSRGGALLGESAITVSNPLGITQSAQPFQSYQIPAGTLNAGDVYEARLDFATALDFDTTSVPGSAAASFFRNELLFYLGAPTGSPPAPVLAADLISQNGTLGGTVTLSATVTAGGAPISGNYAALWYFNGQQIAIDGVKYVSSGTSLQINNINEADSGPYYAKFITTGGLIVTSTVNVTVETIGPPVITRQPVSVTVNSDGTAVFTAAATGTDLEYYRWWYSPDGGKTLMILYDGNGISGTGTPQLVIQNATSSNQGEYYWEVGNPGGGASSSHATLTVVNSSDPGRLINLSVLSTAGGKSQPLSVGFVSAYGSGSQTLLLRAIGPSLAGFNVSGWMPDPQLQLFNGASSPTLIASDAGWASASANETAVSAADTATGAFALSNPASADSALVQDLSPGRYSAQISSISETAGQVLAEIYDDTPSYTLSLPRLANLSCSVAVPQGGALTAGFVVGGQTAETVLIRASGPALTTLGVSDVMPDPQIAVYNQQQQVVFSLAGWGGDPAVAAAATSVGAFPYTDPASKDTATLLTLSPGSYTIATTSASGSAGEVLIEIYEVP